MANGNKYIFEISTDGGTTYGLFGGQLEGTFTYTKTSIEITNKANGGAVTYMENEKVGEQCAFSGTFTPDNSAGMIAVTGAYETGAFIDGKITAPNNETYTANFVVTDRSDTAPLNGAATMQLGLSSSGGYTRTPIS